MTAEGTLKENEVSEEVDGGSPLWISCMRNGDLTLDISR
jgi:hypothetical protein